MFQARKATTSEMTLPVPEGYVPQPSIRHEVDPNIGAPLPPKTTECATSLPEKSQNKLFIGFEPQAFMAHFKQDFCSTYRYTHVCNLHTITKCT